MRRAQYSCLQHADRDYASVVLMPSTPTFLYYTTINILLQSCDNDDAFLFIKAARRMSVGRYVFPCKLLLPAEL